MTSRPQFCQTAFSAAALALGIGVYLFDRSANEIYFVPDWWSAADGVAGLFGAIGLYLPTFAHVYAFTLITAAVLKARPHAAIVICGAWLIVEAAFEIGQHASIATEVAAHLPAWFSGVPVLDHIAGYFLNGRFDPLDLFSILLGAFAAYATVLLSFYREPKT